MSELRDNPDNVEVVHEESDVNVGAIIRYGIGLRRRRRCRPRVSLVAAGHVRTPDTSARRRRCIRWPPASRIGFRRTAISGKPAAGAAGASREAKGAARRLRLGQQGGRRGAHPHRRSDEDGGRARDCRRARRRNEDTRRRGPPRSAGLVPLLFVAVNGRRTARGRRRPRCRRSCARSASIST